MQKKWGPRQRRQFHARMLQKHLRKMGLDKKAVATYTE